MIARSKPERTPEADPMVALQNAMATVPEGPWFAASDSAEDTVPHRSSGLALVDTGRTADWPIARLCEWNTATFIAACGEGVPALFRRIFALECALAEARAEGFRRGVQAAADLLERDADWPGDYDRAFAIIDEIRALRPEGEK